MKASSALVFVLLTAGTVFAQPETHSIALSIDQRIKLSEIVTNNTSKPLGPTNFPVAIGAIVPADVSLKPLPPEAEVLVPQLRGASYLAVEELVAIVDTSSRKITIVMQRMRLFDLSRPAPLGRAVQSVGTIGSHAILGGLHLRFSVHTPVDRQVRDGARFCVTTRQTLLPWICSLSRPLA